MGETDVDADGPPPGGGPFSLGRLVGRCPGRGAFLRAAAGDSRLASWLVIALAVRFVLLPWFSDPYNFRVFGLTASLVQSGQNPWVVIASDPALAAVNPWGYPPLYLTPVLAASVFSLGNGFLFGVLIRLPLIAASLATSIFVHRSALGLGVAPGGARRAAAAYALNPFVILVDTVWGTNDPLPVACAAGALLFLLRKPERPDLAALLLGFGVAFKLYPIVLLPAAIAHCSGLRARIRFLAFAAVPGAVTAGPLLLASPGQFLNILGVFVVGGSPAASHMTVGYLVEAAGAAPGSLTLALSVAYLVGIGFAAFLHAKGRISLVQAFAISTLGLFLAAPRLLENYFLWPLAPVAVAASAGAFKGWTQRAASWIWIPVAASAFIYNGARGITGPFYWGLIAGAPSERPYLWFPSNTRLWLTAAALCAVAGALAGLLRKADGPDPVGHWTAQAGASFGSLASPAAARAFLAASMAALVLGSALVAAADRPLGPEDFGAYSFSEGQQVYTERFDSGLLDQTWTYGGAGLYELAPAAAGTLSLDTRLPGGNAFITRKVPDTAIHLRVSASVERVDGTPGLLLIARVPAGWVGVQNRTPSGGLPDFGLIFFDEGANRIRDLGRVVIGDSFSFDVRVLPNATYVSRGTLSVTAAGGPITYILIGQRDTGSGIGGRLRLDQIEISWPAPPSAAAPGLGPSVVSLAVGATVVAVWWWRARPT